MAPAKPPIPIKRLQRADGALGLVACALLQPLRWLRRPRRPRPGEDALLLMKFWGLGSLQLLTPAVAALRERHPGAPLILLTLRENRAFARGLGVFDEVLSLDVRSASWTVLLGRILLLIRRLRRRRFDAVYDFEFFTRFSAVVTILTGARRTHGFAAPTVWRGRFHTRTVPFNRYWHVSRNFRCLAGGENGRDVQPGDLRPYGFGEADTRGARAALAAAELLGDGPLVVLNPNAGDLSLERRWPPELFAGLAARLVREDGARVALVGSAGEADWTGRVRERARELGVPPRRIADLAGRLAIGELAALLAEANVFVTNDSGPMHVAAALGTPTVGLFGPETPVMYGPLGRAVRALYKPPACSPCINVHEAKLVSCYRGQPDCLTGLSIDEVASEARALLRRSSLRSLGGGRADPAVAAR